MLDISKVQKNKKTSNIVFRVDDAEKELIEQVADLYGLNVSEYVRMIMIHDANIRIQEFDSSERHSGE